MSKSATDKDASNAGTPKAFVKSTEITSTGYTRKKVISISAEEGVLRSYEDGDACVSSDNNHSKLRSTLKADDAKIEEGKPSSPLKKNILLGERLGAVES